jgi:CheY-like chemotaxis protein
MKRNNCVLLIEDDPIDVMSVKRAFEENNITNPLYVVGNGEEGLAYLRHEGKYTEPDSSPIPTLILLDLNMPRMGGLEMLAIVKRDPDFQHIPIVILTTSDVDEDIKQSYQHGVAGYLVKPVTFEKFSKAIQIFDLYWTLSELP